MKRIVTGRLRRIAAFLFAGVLGLMFVNPGFANPKPVLLRVGHSMSRRADSLLHARATAFKTICESESQGRLEVEIYSIGEIGSERVMFESVQMGSVDMVYITQGPIPGFYNDIMVLEIPYLFSSYPVAYEFFRSPAWKEIADDFVKKTGVRILGVSESGFRHTTNSVRPIFSPRDFRGLKIRTMESPAIMESVRALGADPTAVAWGEVYTALQQRVVDGQQNPLPVIRDSKFYEIQRYVTLDGGGYNSHFAFFNERRLRSLPDDLRSIVIRAVRMSDMVQRGMQVTQYYDAIRDLTGEGMTVCIPTESQLLEFKRTTQQPVIDWLVRRGGVSRALVDKVISTTDAIERSLAQGW